MDTGQRILTIIQDTLQDCKKLKRRGELTQYGEGRLELCQIIVNELKKEEANMEKKYKTDDFKGITTDERILSALTAIANEIHNAYSVLWKSHEKRKE